MTPMKNIKPNNSLLCIFKKLNFKGLSLPPMLTEKTVIAAIITPKILSPTMSPEANKVPFCSWAYNC